MRRGVSKNLVIFLRFSPISPFKKESGLLGEFFSGALRDLDEELRTAREGGGGGGGRGGGGGGMGGGGGGGGMGGGSGMGGGMGGGGGLLRTPSKEGGASSSPVERLEAMGLRVILPHEAPQKRVTTDAHSEADGRGDTKARRASGQGWDALAGSDAVRSALDESLLLPLLHPEIYREVMQGTRTDSAVHPHAKAVLFEGPPGCGKTSAARILAKELGRPFVPLPLETLVSKW